MILECDRCRKMFIGGVDDRDGGNLCSACVLEYVEACNEDIFPEDTLPEDIGFSGDDPRPAF